TISTNLTVSGPGPLSLTITGNNTVAVFSIIPGVTVTLSGMTLQNGVGSSSLCAGSVPCGGGIYNGGTLTVTNTFVFQSTAWLGGGVFNAGTLTLNGTTISGNSAGDHGGGIYNTGDM